jgi:protease I
VDIALDKAEDFDALVLPGGVLNADELRTYPDAVSFVKAFFDQGTPVAAICHAPWIVEAKVVSGRTLTSWPSLQTDIRNAGGKWVDHEWSRTVSLRPAGSPTIYRRSIERCSMRSPLESDRSS